MATQLKDPASLGRQRAWLISASIALVVFIALSWGLEVAWRSEQKEQANLTAHYTQRLVEEMVRPIIDQFGPLESMQNLPCSRLRNQLAKTAALDVYVRAIAMAYPNRICHSFKGSIPQNGLQQWAPHNMGKQLLTLIPGSSLAPGHIGLVVWRGKPDLSQGIMAVIDGQHLFDLLNQMQRVPRERMSLVVGDMVMLTNPDRLVPYQPHKQPFGQATSSLGFRVEAAGFVGTSFYHGWVLLISLLMSVVLGLLSYLLFNRKQGLGSELKKAMKNDEFFLMYQPVFALSRKQPVGVEVLMRWRHPVQGLISPDIFIRTAEETGLIVPLTRHLFELLCNDFAHWSQGPLKVGINIASAHLQQGLLTSDLLHLQQRLGPSLQLVAELTERQLIDSQAMVITQLKDCRAAGIQIAVDDFGTGHSSLAYLQVLPLDYLKIDKSFVSALDSGSVQAPVLEAIMQLGHKLGLTLVAEGIETQRQYEFLNAHEVEMGQGYLFARPMPMAAFRQWLADNAATSTGHLTASHKVAGRKPD
ncbi:EAL domain-containing protein [Gallaecimonas mangrovi]|uniref:EAL domain-containing protein n=1 Tax=Gallaecimonas mangrovi TaxID=2291597 RepID=UPI000E2055CA|nr:EAL domain-containing protein [Gallaecimonas mangrovi]